MTPRPSRSSASSPHQPPSRIGPPGRQVRHGHGQHTAYLVIYNITDKLLELPTDGTPGAWPP